MLLHEDILSRLYTERLDFQVKAQAGITEVGVFWGSSEILDMVSAEALISYGREDLTPPFTHGPNRPRFLNFLVRLMMVALALGPSTSSEVDI